MCLMSRFTKKEQAGRNGPLEKHLPDAPAIQGIVTAEIPAVDPTFSPAHSSQEDIDWPSQSLTRRTFFSRI